MQVFLVSHPVFLVDKSRAKPHHFARLLPLTPAHSKLRSPSFLFVHDGIPLLSTGKASTVKLIELLFSPLLDFANLFRPPLLFSFLQHPSHPPPQNTTPNITNLQPARLLDVNHFGFFGLCLLLILLLFTSPPTHIFPLTRCYLCVSARRSFLEIISSRTAISIDTLHTFFPSF